MGPVAGATRGIVRRLALAGAGGALLVALAVPASATAQSACPGADEPLEAMTQAQAENAVVCLSNAARASAGLRPLSAHSQLQTAARRHAADMEARGYFDHVAPSPAPNGATLLARIQSSGYPLRTAAENLASGQPTPRRATDAWLKSPGHCRNLLDAAFTELGVGRGPTSLTWVQVLATRSTPSNAGSFPGCETGDPPGLAHVAGGPATAVSDQVVRPPRSSGLRVRSVSRTRTHWIIRLQGSAAAGRTATVRSQGALRKCVKEPGRRERCSTVPGARHATARVKLRTGTTTVRVRRRAADRFVTVTHAAFRKDGTQYGARTVNRQLPR